MPESNEIDPTMQEELKRLEHQANEENKLKAELPEPMMQFFAYAHLPEKLQKVSIPFCKLAEFIVETLPRNPERTVALRKLLEAKDCAVRAQLYK